MSLNNISITCTHPTECIIVDYSNGCEVCTTCGRVVTDQIFSSGVPTNSQIDQRTKTFDNYVGEFVFATHKQYDLLYNICAQNHIHKQIQHVSLQLFTKRLKTFNTGVSEAILTACIASCIYDACQQAQVSRSMAECAAMCKVSLKLFNKVYNKFHTTHTCINVVTPTDIFPRVKGNLTPLHELSRTEEIRLLYIADYLFYTANFTAPAVLAYCLYNFGYYRWKQGQGIHMPMKVIAQVCCVSCTCIKRTLKRWGKLHPAVYSKSKPAIQQYLKMQASTRTAI